MIKAATTIYEGQTFICRKHGHPLIVIYEDGYHAMLAELSRAKADIERLEERIYSYKTTLNLIGRA